jgi:hypothetical protein
MQIYKYLIGAESLRVSPFSRIILPYNKRVSLRLENADFLKKVRKACFQSNRSERSSTRN